jgi:hypothetical protein
MKGLPPTALSKDNLFRKGAELMSSFPDPKIRPKPVISTTGQLRQLRDRLQDLNTAFPETKKFLTRRGLDHVSQLDSQGLKDLREYLQGVYKRSVH